MYSPFKLLLTISAFIVPICLPYDADAKDDYQKLDEPVYVAGWGVTGPRSKFTFLYSVYFCEISMYLKT